MLIERPANECPFLGASLAGPYQSLQDKNRFQKKRINDEKKKIAYCLTSIIKFLTDRKLGKEIEQVQAANALFP